MSQTPYRDGAKERFANQQTDSKRTKRQPPASFTSDDQAILREHFGAQVLNPNAVWYHSDKLVPSRGFYHTLRKTPDGITLFIRPIVNDEESMDLIEIDIPSVRDLVTDSPFKIFGKQFHDREDFITHGQLAYFITPKSLLLAHHDVRQDVYTIYLASQTKNVYLQKVSAEEVARAING